MKTCTCYHSTGCQPIRPLKEQISAEQMERIRKAFPSVKPTNEEPLATRTDAVEQAPAEPKHAVISRGPVTPFHTGYARIDNAITDALRGKSQELKDGVYDIIRNDLLPHNVHGLEEEDRLALIGLGVEKAEYLADQYMDGAAKSSFMEAIRSIARIGTQGTRVGSCEMEYNVKHSMAIDGNGYIHEDISGEVLYSMQREDPKAYETYQALEKSSGNGKHDAAIFSMKWFLANISALVRNRPGYEKQQDEKYKKLQTVKLDQTFAGADTSGKEQFLASLTEKLLANKNLQVSFFLDRIAKMSNVSGSYLLARQMVLYAKA